MEIGVISVRYARALLKSASEQKTEDEVCRNMQTLAASYIDLPQLKTAVDNPMLPKDKKKTLIMTACGTNPASLTERFVDLVLKEGREDILQFMANSYVTLYRQQKQIISGKLTTAVQVTPETEQKMRQMVEKRTNETVEFETEIDPEIIGGFILEYDTYRLDASVKSALRNILNTLKQ